MTRKSQIPIENQKILFILSNKFEARQALNRNLKTKAIKFIAVGLEAEFYLENNIKSYTNPSYRLKGLNGKKSIDNYYYSNFKISYSWYKNPHYQYLREKLGFYLSELDRSLDFANKVISYYKPKKIIVGDWRQLEKIPLIDVRLEPLAISLAAKSRHIPLEELKLETANTVNFRGNLSRFLQLVRIGKKQKLAKNFDVFVVAPASKLANMEGFVSNFTDNKISSAYLTYEVARKDRKKIDSSLEYYYEKERIISNKEISKSKTVLKQLIRNKEWKSFTHPKYVNQPQILSFMQNKIYEMVQNEMGNILRDHFLAERVLKETKPKVLLTLTDPDPKALTFINAAKKLGIKTISLQHGADFDRIPYSKPKSDYHVVWSDFAREYKLKNLKSSSGEYLDKNKILIARSPFHEIVSKRKKHRKRSKPKLLLLMVNHIFDKSIWNYYLKKLFVALETIKDKYEIRVRLHPHQDIREFEAIRNSICNFSYANEEDLNDVIDDSDIILFENTTAGLDAMLHFKPTMFFNPYTGEDFFELGRKNVSISVLFEKDIHNKMIPFLKDKKLWKKVATLGKGFALDYLGLGKKQNSTADLIKKIIKN